MTGLDDGSFPVVRMSDGQDGSGTGGYARMLDIGHAQSRSDPDRTTGDDTREGHLGNDTLTGLDGNDLLVGQDADDSLNGGRSNDTVEAGSGSDRLVGGSDDGSLSGGAGHDTLRGEAGDDTLTGGLGVDRFAFATADGMDRITDFGDGSDVIAITAGATPFSDLANYDLGADALVVFPDVVIRVENVDHALLDASDFVF